MQTLSVAQRDKLEHGWLGLLYITRERRSILSYAGPSMGSSTPTDNRVNPRFVSESLRSIPLYGALQASTDENQICDDAPHTDRAPPGSTQPCGNCRSFANPIKKQILAAR